MTSPEPADRPGSGLDHLPGTDPRQPGGGPAEHRPVADSSSLTFNTPPNIDGTGTVVNFHFPGGYLRALPTRATVTASPNIGTTIEATFEIDTLPDLLRSR